MSHYFHRWQTFRAVTLQFFCAIHGRAARACALVCSARETSAERQRYHVDWSEHLERVRCRPEHMFHLVRAQLMQSLAAPATEARKRAAIQTAVRSQRLALVANLSRRCRNYATVHDVSGGIPSEFSSLATSLTELVYL